MGGRASAVAHLGLESDANAPAPLSAPLSVVLLRLAVSAFLTLLHGAGLELGPRHPCMSSWLTTQVDLRKVNISVLRSWVAQKITELLKFEDDVVVEYAYGLLENKDDPVSWLTHDLVLKLTRRCPIRARCKSA
jgi:hypothetical protein